LASFERTIFVFEQRKYSLKEILALKSAPDWLQTVQNQLIDFTSTRNEMEFYTSGSTGTPKRIVHEKKVLKASAERTLDFFSLKSGDSAALILPAQFIGGSMMLVRALVGGLTLHLLPPKLVVKEIPNVDFLPCTPAQFKAAMQNEAFRDFTGAILLGGAPVGDIKPINGMAIYVGYGMTETASHVALRALSENVYSALDGVQFTSKEDALVIDAPHLGIEKLQTNDLVRLIDTQSFEFVGRIDDVINTGGLKIHPAVLESHFHSNGYVVCVSSTADEVYGETVVIVVEGVVSENSMKELLIDVPRSQQPKFMLSVERLPLLESGKLDRTAIRRLIQESQHRLFPL
jgi:O-succinylbenzoic acid--CoA ligase